MYCLNSLPEELSVSCLTSFEDSWKLTFGFLQILSHLPFPLLILHWILFLWHIRAMNMTISWILRALLANRWTQGWSWEPWIHLISVNFLHRQNSSNVNSKERRNKFQGKSIFQKMFWSSCYKIPICFSMSLIKVHAFFFKHIAQLQQQKQNIFPLFIASEWIFVVLLFI